LGEFHKFYKVLIGKKKRKKRRKLYFGSAFQRFQSIVLGSIDSGPMVKVAIMVDGSMWRRSYSHRA
jgi:hypothetical protein